MTAPLYAAAVGETVKRLEAMPHVNSAISPLSRGGAAFLSKDQKEAATAAAAGGK